MTGQQVRIVAEGSIWHVVGVIDGIATLRHPTERHDCPGHRLHGKPGEVFAPNAQLIPVDSHTLSTGAPGEVQRDPNSAAAPGADSHRGARNTDPDTSHEAAESITDLRRNTDHALVLALLFEYGPLTDFDLARLASSRTGHLVKQTSIGVRRSELRNAGLVVDSGHKGKSDTGARAIRWALTAAGEQEAAA